MGRSGPAVAVLLLAALTACTNAPAPGGMQQRGPAGDVPPGLERFYGQPLEWRSCTEFGTPDAPDDTDCAWLETPLDYADPGGRTVRTGVTRHRATDQENRVGTLAVDTGGGVTFRMSTAGTFGDAELRERFDVVAMDRRGTGTSDLRAHCYDDAGWDRERSIDAPGKDRAFTEACLRNSGAEVLSALGTDHVARDLDVLRSALGERQLDLYAASSGTRAAISYAEALPGAVRTLVLDGPVGTRAPDVVALARDQGRALQSAFDASATGCAPTPGCPLGPDPARAADRLHDLLLSLLDRPPSPADGRPLTFTDAMLGVTSAIDVGATDRLRAALTSDDLLGLQELTDQLYYRRDRAGNYADDVASETAIQCADQPRPNQALVDAAESAYYAAAPFRDTRTKRSPGGRQAPNLGSVAGSCPSWPVPPTWTPHVPQARGLPAGVVVSATGDPLTPYGDGVEQAHALGARLVTYQAGTHVNFLRGNECVDVAVTGYLVAARPPETDLTCR